MSLITPQNIKCYDIDRTIFKDTTLDTPRGTNAGHMHSALSMIAGCKSSDTTLNTHTIVYDTNTHALLGGDRIKMLDEARKLNMVFNDDIIALIAKDIKDGKAVAMTSFTHYPDVAYTLITEQLKKTHGITGQLQSSFRIIGGFPEQGPNDPERKTQHIIRAQLAFGIPADKVSLNGASLVDDDAKNILRAWAHGMQTSWVNQNAIQPNQMPIEDKNRRLLTTLTVNLDGSLIIPPDISDAVLQELRAQTGMENIQKGITLLQPRLPIAYTLEVALNEHKRDTTPPPVPPRTQLTPAQLAAAPEAQARLPSTPSPLSSGPSTPRAVTPDQQQIEPHEYLNQFLSVMSSYQFKGLNIGCSKSTKIQTDSLGKRIETNTYSLGKNIALTDGEIDRLHKLLPEGLSRIGVSPAAHPTSTDLTDKRVLIDEKLLKKFMLENPDPELAAKKQIVLKEPIFDDPAKLRVHAQAQAAQAALRSGPPTPTTPPPRPTTRPSPNIHGGP